VQIEISVSKTLRAIANGAKPNGSVCDRIQQAMKEVRRSMHYLEWTLEEPKQALTEQKELEGPDRSASGPVIIKAFPEKVEKQEPNPAKPLQDGGKTEFDLETAERLYEQALEDGADKWMRSKLMLIGDGRTGKTSLLRSLLGKPFIDTDSTLGVAISACEVNRTDVESWTEVPGHMSQLQLVAAGLCAAQLVAAKKYKCDGADAKSKPEARAELADKQRKACANCSMRKLTSECLTVHLCQGPGMPTNLLPSLLLCYDCVGTKAHPHGVSHARFWRDTISFRGVTYRPQVEPQSHRVVLHHDDAGGLGRCCDWQRTKRNRKELPTLFRY
jgi:hypothetical protein